MSKDPSANQELAEIASLCLGYLAENPEELARFMQLAGYDPASLRGAINSHGFNMGLLDYFASNEGQLLTLCANVGLKPERFMRLWHRLNPTA